MEQRILGRTGKPVSVVGLGTWQLGADWGNVSEADAMAVLQAAVESGVTLFDTADVYGDGRSERVIGRFLSGNAGQGITVATKMGRRVEQKAEHYTLENFRAWTDRSRVNLGTERLNLVQLHCPPTRSSSPTPSSTRWTRWSPRSGSRRTGSAWKRATRRWLRSRARGWPACRSS